MSRFEALSEVRNYLNSISYINNGGCGIAALVMFRWMKKNRISTKGVKFHFMERFDVNTILVVGVLTLIEIQYQQLKRI